MDWLWYLIAAILGVWSIGAIALFSYLLIKSKRWGFALIYLALGLIWPIWLSFYYYEQWKDSRR